MDQRSMQWGAGFLAVAVALGAFGAHGLKAHLSPEALAQWQTGVLYQFLHAMGLVALSIAAKALPHGRLRWIRSLLVAGVLLFSGSLYLLSTRELTGLHSAGPFLGPLTPLGGLAWVGAWVVLLITARKASDQG